MPDTTKDARIINPPNHPRIFASKVLGVFAEGGGTTTFMFAVTEPQRGTMNSQPEDANVVVASLTLSNNGITELMGAIQSMAAAAALQRQDKPTVAN